MRDPMPPRRGDSNAGWIAGVIIVVLVIIGLFYWGGSQTHTASNAPSPATSTSRPSSPMSPPSTTGSGTTSPTPANPSPSPASPPASPGK
jgi:cytoskeletal protein RodZ